MFLLTGVAKRIFSHSWTSNLFKSNITQSQTV